MKKITLPVLPNTPLKKKNKTKEGYFLLKQFYKYGHVKNVLFRNDLVKYDKKYQNDQSNSLTFQKNMNFVYKILKENFPKKSNLVEVGCGKGAFLSIVKKDNYFNYKGFDETYEGKDKNIHARKLNAKEKIFADIIVLRHTLEHIDSPLKFLNFLKKIFPENSSIFIEVPQFEWIVKNKVLFDFTYEHVNYFTSKSLRSLFSKTKLHGNIFKNQYQFCIANLNKLKHEDIKLYEDKKNWNEFNLSNHIKSFKKKVEYLKNYNNIWIWGGSTKGVMFLKHLSDLRPDLFKKISGVIDINKKKQGLFTPSTKIKIYSPNKLFGNTVKVDLILVMNPNYVFEIKKTLLNKMKRKVKINIL